MKILLISSSCLGIYPFIEQSIVNTFRKLNHNIIKINPEYNQEIIDSINQFNPELCLTLVGHHMDEKILNHLKKKGSALCIWLTEDPFYIDQSIQLIDHYQYIFTIDLGAYEFYKKMFPFKKIYHLPLGTDPTVFYPSDHPSQYLYDLCLVGYPYPERVELIKNILKQTSYSIFLSGSLWNRYLNTTPYKNRLVIVNKWFEPKYVRKIYCQSKIILNPHRTHYFNKNKNSYGIENKSINNRTFDIAASGGFQLLSYKPDLEAYFNSSSEIAPFSSIDECIHLIKDFIVDDKRRNFFSANAYRNVLNNHTFAHRLQFILNNVELDF